MARRNLPSKRRKAGKLKPAQLNLSYILADGISYLDFAKDLSMMNRKLFSQSKAYACAGVTFTFAPSAATAVVSCSVKTAGNTWVVQNAHTKGKALWDEMNKLVLADNPSIRGTWADFKIYLDDHHKTVGNSNPIDGDGIVVVPGEWEYSRYVMPQHEVDPATGLPLAADEFFAHLIGDDTATSKGLVRAYAESRATVQPTDPAVPAGLSTSFFNLLTDSGSQEPELADVIEDANDQPPYHQSQYPGGSVNADSPWFQHTASASVGSPTGHIPGFVAECGLVKFTFSGYTASGEVSPVGATVVTFHMMPGNYQGVLAENMGQ